MTPSGEVKNWTPTGAAIGISIQSMGAALAYLTERGNSAEVASTRLTMGLAWPGPGQTMTVRVVRRERESA
jgi:hypothetical protein